MPDPDRTTTHLDDVDSNDAVWKSDHEVAHWVSVEEGRERRRAEQRRLTAELLGPGDGDEFVVVDLGAGTGAAARAVLDRYPGAFAVLAEFSPQMIAEGERALAPYAGRYRYVELDLRAGPWPAEVPEVVEAVISSLSVHHLADDRKSQLFGEIFARLAPGGWYVNFDPIAAEDPLVAAVWERVNDVEDPEAARVRHDPTPEERARRENHMRHVVPLAPQLEMLHAAGFEAVDVYWKRLDYVIYGGRRPPREAAQ